MKKNSQSNLKLLILCCFILVSSSSYSQKIFELMAQDGVNLKEVQDEAEQHFSIVGKGKGSGFKLFKRWEYHAYTILQDNGKLLSNTARAKAITKGRLAETGKSISTSNWSELGPLAMGFGNSGYSWGIGRITAIYVEPDNQQLIYVGSPGGGLWKSTNGGNSWIPLGDQFANMDIWAVECDPNNSNIVYIGNSLGQLRKSTNGGQSFTTLLDKSGNLRSILINPNNSNDIYVSLTSSGLYHSTNGGSSWTNVISAGIEDVMFKPGSTSTVYACGNKFYKSTNSGSSFTKISNGLPNNARMKLAVTDANSNYVYVVQKANSSGFGSLYRSTNSGDSFSTRSTVATTGDIVGVQAARDMVIGVSNTNANEVHIGGFNMHKSTNGGTSFTQTVSWTEFNPLTYVHADQEVMQVIGNTIYVGSDGGISKSTDGGVTYTDLSEGLGIQQFYKIANSTSNKNVVAGGSQDNGSVVKSGNANSWKQWYGGDGMDCVIDPVNENIIYGCSQFGGFRKTTNGGTSLASVVLPPENRFGNWVTPIALDPNDRTRIYAGYADLYRHDNSATSGEWVNTSSGAFNGKLKHIELCPSNSNVIYVVNASKIYKSTNIKSASPTWSTLSLSGIGINDIAVDPYDENRVVVVTSNGSVQLSTNGGASWTNISSGLPTNTAIKTVVLDRSPNKGIYVAIDGVVFYRSNAVTNWITFSNNLPNVDITELELYYGAAGQSEIRVATYGRGLWESPLYDDAEISGFTCNTTVNSFPYSESFESGIGSWTQDTGDDFDWTQRTGNTPSNTTGPSGANDGNYYIYTEVSGVNSPNKTAILTSPCFNLNSISNPEISFSYHMLGSEVGTVNLEASTDGNNWASIWSKNGAQGSNWIDATVNVSSYASTTVKFRFNVVSGANFRGDICIDNFEITSANATANFVPDPAKKYYIDVPHHDLRLAATGASEDAYTTSTNTTGANVEWKFVAKGNGSWHIQRAAGGTKPRLRTDATSNADMQETSSSGVYTYYDFPPSTSTTGTYYLNLPSGPSNFQRLQVNSSGSVLFVASTLGGAWVSFAITEVPQSSTNLAPTGTASQSSTAFSGVASRANDNNTNGIYTQSSVTHTANTTNPWWEVDLGINAVIEDIKIFNRTDCCMGRLKNYTVSVINANGATTFSQSFNSFPNPSTSISVGNVTGRKVRVQLNEKDFLSLAEVEVYGYEASSLIQTNEGDNPTTTQDNITSILNDSNILIFPNPVSTTMNIQLPTDGEDVSISIVSLTGSTLSNTSFQTHDGLNLLKMNIENLNSGFYLVYILKGETKTIKKIYVD